jgi:hypothetical protein
MNKSFRFYYDLYFMLDTNFFILFVLYAILKKYLAISSPQRKTKS